MRSLRHSGEIMKATRGAGVLNRGSYRKGYMLIKYSNIYLGISVYSSNERALGEPRNTAINVIIPVAMNIHKHSRFNIIDTILHSSLFADSSSFLKMLFITTVKAFFDRRCFECATAIVKI